MNRKGEENDRKKRMRQCEKEGGKRWKAEDKERR
jgi:hypothetical protein